MNTQSNSFKKILSSSGINFLFRIFGLGTSFAIVFIISRLFGISNYGNYSLVFTLSQAISMIFALGIPSTLVMLIGNISLGPLEAKALLFKGVKIVLLFSLIPMLFFYCSSQSIADLFDNNEISIYFKIVAFATPFFIIHELFLYYFIAIKNFVVYNLFMFVLPNFFLLLFLLLFYYLNKADFYTFLSYALSIFFIVLMEFIYVYESKIGFVTSSITTRKLLKTASPVLFSGLLLFLLNWTDVIMLGLMVSESEVGIYNIAYKIGSVGFLVIVSISTFVTPKMAELYGKGNLIELKNVTNNATKLIAVLTIPVIVCIIVFRVSILSLFGPEVIVGSTTLTIISLGVLFSAMSGNVDQVLNMTENQVILRNITIVSFFINVFLNYILIPIYGINGAAFASLVSNVVINLLCVYYIKKKLGFYTLF